MKKDVPMALEKPQLRYARPDAASTNTSPLSRALQLAHEIEELLEDTRTVDAGRPDERSSSTRIARAIAASLTDELAVLERGATASATPKAASAS